MKKRLFSMLIVLCIVFTLLPTTAFAAASLYRVSVDNGAPFRATEGGSIVGNIPVGTVLEVLEVKQGSYAKVMWNGYPVYVWTDKLKAVSAPDAVCSEWSREWITAMEGEYVGLKSQYPDARNDYTKPLTRVKMAKMMMIMMEEMYGQGSIKYLPLAIGEVNFPLTDTQDSYASRLALWGVVPQGAFRPDAIATYGEVVDTMVKLMDYDNKYIYAKNYGHSRTPITREFIANLGIGGDTSAAAPCTEEQLMVMYGKLVCWLDDYQLKADAPKTAADVGSKTTEGLPRFVSGTYTIQTLLGETGKHPYVVINADGKGELRSTPQSFNVTYLGKDWEGFHYTIQTMDGKYLAISGMAVNGSPLILQDAPYPWKITGGGWGYICSAENSGQRLNTSQQKSSDGTAIISWDLTSTYDTGNDNYKFLFEYAK